MKVGFYVSPNFMRNGYFHSKIMFYAENLGYFGVFVNGRNGNIEKQAYEFQKMKHSNLIGDNKCLGYYTRFEGIKNSWGNFTSEAKERIIKASQKANEALKFFIKKYNNQINSFAGDVTPREVIDILETYVGYFTGFIDGLQKGYDVNIDLKFESGIFSFAENVNETKSDTRKSVNMFKVINAGNLENLFEGNFYPIVNIKDGYVTIKDDNGNNCTIRASRGKEIQVFTECPA